MSANLHPRPTQSARRDPSRRARLPQLTERDRALLRDLVRFGALTLAQLARWHFGSTRTASGRLALLARGGLLVRRRIWYRGPSVYVATPAGVRLADTDLPTARLVPETLAHQLGVVDVALFLLQQEPGCWWTTERELRRDAMRLARERGQGRAGTPHIPDGLLTGPSGRVAVELELSTKQRAAYERIFRWYAGAVAYDRVRWFVRSRALAERLTDLLRRHDLADFMAVDGLPASMELPTWL